MKVIPTLVVDAVSSDVTEVTRVLDDDACVTVVAGIATDELDNIPPAAVVERGAETEDRLELTGVIPVVGEASADSVAANRRR
jgi:hypothetical protein